MALFVQGREVVGGLDVLRLGHVRLASCERTSGMPFIIILSGIHDLRGMNSMFHASSTCHMRHVFLYKIATAPPSTRVRGATLKTRSSIT